MGLGTEKVWPATAVSGSFSVSQFFASGGQSIGASALASVLPVNIQDLFPLGLTGWVSLQSKGLSRVFSKATVQKHQFFSTQQWHPTPVLLPGKSHGQRSLVGCSHQSSKESDTTEQLSMHACTYTYPQIFCKWTHFSSLQIDRILRRDINNA